MNAPTPHKAVAPDLLATARIGDPAAVARALAHCRAWSAAGSLPADLRAWLAEWARQAREAA